MTKQNALDRVTRGLKEIEAAASELYGVAVLYWSVREGCARSSTIIDARASALCEFTMAGDKVGVQMSLDDVLDLHAPLFGRFDVDVKIALGKDDRGDAARTNHVRGVCQATKEKLFDYYGFCLHVSVPGGPCYFA
jgi:hypothetical protein